jgi:hypothetical protein
MKIGQLSFISDFSNKLRRILNRKGTCMEHRAIRRLSIGLYFKNEMRCQICYILREFCRLGCPCYRYMFPTGNVTSNPKFGALFPILLWIFCLGWILIIIRYCVVLLSDRIGNVDDVCKCNLAYVTNHQLHIPCEIYSATGGKIIISDQERGWRDRGMDLLPCIKHPLLLQVD